MISLPKQLVVIGDSSVYGWGDNEGVEKNAIKNVTRTISKNRSPFDRSLKSNSKNI